MHWLLRVAQFIVRHKYAVAVVVFLVVTGLTDSNSLYVRSGVRAEIRKTQAEIDDYNNHYERDRQTLELLDSDPHAMQKIARERYFMKKPNEDVYVVE